MTRNEIIMARVKRGERYAEIAASLGVSRALIAGVVYRARHPATPRNDGGKPFWTGEQIETLRKMHRAGCVAAEIGEAVGKSSVAVRHQGKRLGLKWTATKRKNKSWHPKIGESEAVTEKKLRDGDARLLRALALAFKRGDHLPAASHPQGCPRSSGVSGLLPPHKLSEAA